MTDQNALIQVLTQQRDSMLSQLTSTQVALLNANVTINQQAAEIQRLSGLIEGATPEANSASSASL